MLPFGRMLEYGNIKPINIEVKKVATGTRHFFVLSSTGELWGSGNNQFKQFGLPDTSNYMGTYVKVADSVENIWAGNDFSIMKKTDGSFWHAGTGGIDSSGYSEWTRLDSEFGLLDPADVVDVFCSFNMMHFKNSTGELYALGLNGNNNAGTSTGGATLVCTKLPGISSVDYVLYTGAAGTAVALTTNGVMYGWGRNANGELGTNNNNAISTPSLIDDSVGSITTGYSAIGYTMVGTRLRTAGNQIYGQLGNGNNSSTHVNQMRFQDVTAPPNLNGIKMPIYRSGGEFNMSIFAGGGIYCTGYSTSVFGTGTSPGTSYPYFSTAPAPFSPSDVVGICAMTQTSCVYTKDKMYQSGASEFIIGFGAPGNILNYIEVSLPWS